MSLIEKNCIQGREVRVVFRQTQLYQAIGSLLREEGLFITIDKFDDIFASVFKIHHSGITHSSLSYFSDKTGSGSKG